jgi:hypothetical protein
VLTSLICEFIRQAFVQAIVSFQASHESYNLLHDLLGKPSYLGIGLPCE